MKNLNKKIILLFVSILIFPVSTLSLADGTRHAQHAAKNTERATKDLNSQKDNAVEDCVLDSAPQLPRVTAEQTAVNNASIPGSTITADSASSNDRRPWGIFLYYGKMTDLLLNQVLRFQFKSRPEELYSAEISYDLAPENPIEKFFSKYLWADFTVAFNATYQNDTVGPIYEFNPYVYLTWSRFPWRKYLYTGLSIGEGVSYATDIPAKEIDTTEHGENAHRFINYLMFQAAFGLPQFPNFQVAYYIYHRSTVFGLYNSSNAGSTAIGIGIRYKF